MKDKPTILIVDDEIKNIELQKACLEPYNYEILTALNSEEAIKVVDGNDIDLILLDVLMPGKDGFDVTRCLKANKDTYFIPIILVTALTEKKDRVDGIEAGCDDFISKPVDITELLARVKSLLKVKAYHDHMRNYERELEREVARRTKELKKTLVMLKETSLETIFRLSMAAEYKDRETGAHIQRMSHYSAAVAREMGLDKGITESILYAAPMHDIGKIGIPDYILLKEDDLDAGEWEFMKQHTIIGSRILHGSKQELIKMAEVIALTHHEKWDGTGYPQRLKGKNIPIAGRITAIADVFDALISKRPYKEPYSIEKSLKIIKENKGKHFDPDVVDAFLDIKQEVLSIVEQYKDYA